MKCPNCHECPFERGVCERLANRGRRYFLMGALVLPVAAKLARVAPVYEPPKLKYLGNLGLPHTIVFKTGATEWALAI